MLASSKSGQPWCSINHAVSQLQPERARFGEVFYWYDRGEVDFVVNVDGEVTPIQVSYDEPTQRHYRATEEFYERFPHAEETVFVTAAKFETALARL